MSADQTKTPIQQFSEQANKIQKQCACIHWGARECVEARYLAPIDDYQRSILYEEMQQYESPCECSCHDDISELEADIFGEPEY